MLHICTYKYYYPVVFCLAFIIASTNAFALDIKDVRFGQHPDKTRMVLDLSEITDFRAFTLSAPPRMVIDLPTFNWRAGGVIKPQPAMISDIRQGKLTPEISRIVFDLDQTVIIKSAFMLPKNGTKENRLVIDYIPASIQEFNNNKGDIHGTLKLDSYNNAYTPMSDGVPYPPSNSKRPINRNNKPLIIIDPGHGGADPGTVGKKHIYEKDLALSIAKELKKQLIASGKYRVLLTRETDKFIRLSDRVKFARKYRGDLFISLHINSNHKPNIRGVSVYTLSKKASDEQTAKLAEKENQADMIAGINFNVEDEQVAFILGDFLMNETMNQSKFFANLVVSKIAEHGIHTLHNTHRYAGFAVLKAPDIPSILIEAGFISNKKDLRLLNNKNHKRKMAKAIQKAIDIYFANVYKNATN